MGPGRRATYDLVSVSDDATNEMYYAVLVEEENTREVLRALRTVVATQGVFCALYTDRASHFIHTPPAGQPRHQTQVERALQQLGIELICAHSPQARGRKERLYRTVQGRWPQELRLRGVTTVAAANAWLQAEGIAAFNRRFAVPPRRRAPRSCPTTLDLERICTVQHERVVSPPTPCRWAAALTDRPVALRCHFVKCHVTVHEHLDGTLSITYGPHVLGRYTEEGQPLTTEAAA